MNTYETILLIEKISSFSLKIDSNTSLLAPNILPSSPKIRKSWFTLIYDMHPTMI